MAHVVLYDVLIPIELHPGLGFTGSSGRPAAFNNEKTLSIWNWRASLHETPDHMYLIVRTNCPELEAHAAVDKIIRAFGTASIFLDAGIRATSNEVLLGSDDVDLMCISIFPAGIMPHTFSGTSAISVSAPIEKLSEAFNRAPPTRRNLDRAAEVYADIDFEASTTSRLVLVATVLELIAARTQRDATALEMIERWTAEAQSVGRQDLVTALSLMREQSITSAIREVIGATCKEAGLSDEDSAQMQQRTVSLYRRRGAIVHGGSAATPEEVAEFRAIGRFALTGSKDRGAFSGVVEGFARDKTNRPQRRL